MRNLRLGVLIHDEFPELELWYPVFRAREEDANPVIIGIDSEKGYMSQLGYAVMPDIALQNANPSEFDVIVLPGGEAGKRIAGEGDMLSFLKEVFAHGGVIAAVSTAKEALVKANLPIPADASASNGVAIAGQVVTAGTADHLPTMMKVIQKVASNHRKA